MSQPSISEHTILSSYLLTTSPLAQIISFSEFLKCVPSQYKDHPHVKRLYRDLQFQRDIDVDSVRLNVERECRKSGVLRGRLAAKLALEHANAHGASKLGKKRKRENAAAVERQDSSEEDEVSANVNVSETIYGGDAHPATRSLPVKAKAVAGSSNHTTSSLLDAMEASIVSIKREDEDLDTQSTMLLKDLRETIGQLSDLRYGRFARGNAPEETFEETLVSALNALESAARKATDGMQ